MTLPAHHRRVAMWGWLAMLVAGAAVFAACGSPDDGEDAFTFDPEPYVSLPDGRRVSVEPDSCVTYIADMVVVLVDTKDLTAVKDRIAQLRWEIEREYQTTLTTSLWLRVPLGSVRAAIDEINQQNGVIGAVPYRLGGGPPEDPLPTPPVPCEPREDP